MDLKVYGFEWYGHNRFTTHRNAPKPSGGVGFLVKQSVFNSFHVRVLDKAYDGILGLELRHKDTDTRVAMFTCYLPPKISPWGRDADSFFSHLLTQIYLNYGMDSIVLFGDFNARVGKVNDYNCEFDEIRRRKVIDELCNKHGQSFIDFLNDSKFCVLNGRFGEQSTQYTSISTRGKAVVDYVCVPHDVQEQCLDFKLYNCNDMIDSFNLTEHIGTRSKPPDHSLPI